MLGANYKKPGGLPQTTSLPEFLSLMQAGLIRIIRTMAVARSVKWKTMKKKNHSSFSIEMLTVYAMMP